MKTYPMIIDGKRLTAPRAFDVRDPATGEVFARCASAEPEHLDAAVAAAWRAFEGWSRVGDSVRKELVGALAGALERNMPELMELLTRESGKPLGGYMGIGSGMEVGGSMAWTQATAALELGSELVQDDAAARVEVHRRPLGVVGSIPPWNWPLMIAVWHVMPALRAGNTVVLKPSSLTPLATTRFVELANEILPPGVLNVLTAERGIGAAMAKHPGIRKMVFTGSTPTGKSIMQNGAANLTRCTLELGGNDAGIVLPDVDAKAIAPRLFAACFHNNGQTCAALKRLYVHEAVHDAICRELVAVAGRVKVGNGLEKDVDFGPVQNRDQLDFVAGLADDARRAGGKLLCGGERRSGPGYFYPLTIVAGLSDGTRLVDEEQFGPILPVIRYSDVEDALRRANASPFGLGGSVWSSDVARATALASRLECGSAWVNDHAAIQPNAPFGGVKQSGYGVEFGRLGLEEYTSVQTVKVVKAA